MNVIVKPENDPLLRTRQRPVPFANRLIFSPAIEVTAMCAYYLRDCFAGFFRYYLDITGLSPLWYLPDFAALACMFLFMYRQIYVGRSKPAFLFICYLFVSIVISAIFFRDALAAISSIKMFMPAFVGLCFAARPVNELKSIRFIFYFVFIVSCIGIFWNSLMQLPWEGFAYQSVGAGERSAGRIWWQGEERRLGGFAADSTMAGFFIMAGYAVFAFNSKAPMRLAVGVIAVYMAYLSTSKTSVLTIGVAVAILSVTWLLGRQRELKVLNRIAKLSYLTIPIPFILIAILGGINLTDISQLLYSMQDRVNNSWVLPVTYMWELFPPGFITGCGLGCFNYPMELFETSVQSYWVPVDNFYYGTYLMFGIPFLYLLYIQVFKQKIRDPLVSMITIIMNIFGITVLCYGPASSLLLFGIMFSNCFASAKYTAIIEHYAQMPPIRLWKRRRRQRGYAHYA